ncbi:snoRNA-binding rRNA-processing protein utp10 [Coemansia sp. RSA 2610]|nr:snoRNA-binding rRNA-processing protein utp10 [Coemansia sp. RSA 2610]
MVSSLASQLFRMRNVDRVISTERAQRVRASFLFEGRQAADIDSQTIFDIGSDGLKELRQIDRRFDVFAATLFSPAVKDLDRVLQTREENARLDESIRTFLFLMAPYFLTKPAGKALEWLIRRFRIQEFNAQDVLAAILPYHETKAFLTMLTIITFDAKDLGMFGFLVTQRKARRLLDRGTLMAQCQRDRELMGFVCTSVFAACKQKLDYPGLHSFYAMIFSQYIGGLASVDDQDLQFVLPYVLDGLGLDGDAQIAAYMVLGTLATRVALTADALEKTLCAVAQHPTDVRAMTMCVVQLVQTQESAVVGRLSLRFVQQLHAHAAFPRVLCELAGEYDVTLFMAPLLTSLAHHALGDAEAMQLLSALVPLLPAKYAGVLCEQLVREYVARGDSDNLNAVLELLQLRYGQQLEDAISACAEGADESVHRLLYQLKMRGSQAGASRVLPLQETATTLYLSISHVDPGMRLVAASALRDIVSGKNREFSLTTEDAGDLLLSRLEHEDDQRVMEIILELPLADYLPAAKLVPALVSLIDRGRLPIEPLSDAIVARLLEADASTDELQAQIVEAAFPFVLQFAGTQAVTRALAGRVKKGGKGAAGWLAGIGKCAGAASEPSKYNKRAVAALGAGLVKQWVQLADAQSGIWMAQLRRAGSLAARTAAIAVGVQAVAQLAASKDASRAVAAASAVLAAALGVLSASSSDGLAAVTEAVASTTADGAQWEQLLGALSSGSADAACAAVAAGSVAAVLNTLATAVELQPNQWFAAAPATLGDAEQAYRALLRTTFASIVARAGGQTGADGVLAGQLLRRCVGGDWAQFLASVWLSEAAAAGVRARALLAFRALASAQASATADYQTVLPAIVAVLGDSDAQVRAAGAACVKQLKQTYPHAPAKNAEQDIYLYDAFYGATSDRLQYLPLAVVVRLVAQLAAHADSMAADAGTLAVELGSILSRGAGSQSAGGKHSRLNGQARASAVTFMVSHVAAADGVVPQLQTRLLEALGAVGAEEMQAQLLPLLVAHVERLKARAAPQAGSAEDRLVRAQFGACYSASSAGRVERAPEAWATFLEYAAGAAAAPDAWGAAEEAQAYVQQLAFERLASGFGDALGPAALAQVTESLIDVAMRGNAYARAGGVGLRDVFARVRLDAAAAADQISAIAGRLAAGGERRRKRARAAGGGDEVAEVATLLECVQGAEMGSSPALVPALAALLAALVGDAAQSGAQAYVLQLVLAMLTRVFDAANAAGVAVAESVVRVDTVVQALRTSASPQTHNQALLLLAAVAAQQPDAVLHHVMAVFTFMGANVLRQDDEYSVHVIQQTLQRVLPALVRRGAAAQAAPVLRVFVDTLTHIPRHRRMALFTTLVRTLGADTHAAPVAALLLEKNAAQRLRGGRGADDVLAFALSLTHELTGAQQLACVAQLLRAVAALPAEPPQAEPAEGEPLPLGLDVARMGAKQLRAFRLVALDYAHQLLTSRQFTAKLADADAALADAAQTLLLLIGRLAAQHAELAARGRLETDVAARAWTQAVQLAYAVLDDVNALMQPAQFAATVARLLGHGDAKVRRKALALATARLGAFDARAGDDAALDAVLALLPPVAAAANAPDGADDARDARACRQAALLCVATAARRFAGLRPAPFVDAAAAVAGAHSLGAAHPAVAAAALVALAVLCDQLGPRLIPALPAYLPGVLKHLRTATAALPEPMAADDLALLIGALSALQAIVANMGAFLAPSLPALLAGVLSPALRAPPPDNAELRAEALAKADAVLAAAATSVPARQLLPALFAFYQRADAAATAVLIVEFAGRAAAALPRNHLTQFHKPLFKFLLGALDVARNPRVPAAAADALEQAALGALQRVVVKLSDALFAPLFRSLVEWATAAAPPPPPAVAWARAADAAATDAAETDADAADAAATDADARAQHAAETRLRVLYGVVNALYAQLRALLAPHYALVLDTTVAQLQRFGVALASLDAQEEADRREKPAPGALWAAVLESVRLSALHDGAGDVWSEDALRRVFRPLADQLANTKAPSYDAYVARVRASLAPAASALLAASGNDAMWKMLNQAVLLRTRSDYACVRHGALLVLQACYERLGEEYLILLPETIPHLAELLEDDDPRVERATHETIKLIESYLGESLQSYLR